ncbi:hypothetical protein Pmar_PMAR003901 [Perkinsus marinus ATCC 50983]|uniref:Uncharacterized protein n=1 Tax=Perkinsus marinus (strain ATCC 50983 / TXsc) TaxID=423536 RepID=C5LXG2_PERM5|nr:hypothetical protein Pmar_PMAR003901 [Perkinsus marinus ATCC 50983]EEQ98580.1 hypothetical protein Pmar_PMAR003901 [Perkinsus marinus ATCC 50983]|eukprot:XP_002765863.1 hypothetical protein Pmar_PMAR003901 [Perkinsus marinus ATCC 50983]
MFLAGFIVSLLGVYAAPSPLNNVRVHVTTKDFCNKDLKDAHGNPAPCGVSQSMGTFGLTLPGMEDGFVTTREDIIITKDGQVSIKALPNYPYQFIMTVEALESTRVEQLYDHQSVVLVDTPTSSYVQRLLSMDTADLEEQGWIHEGTADIHGAKMSRWSKKGPEGVDPEAGTNYTALYQTGLMPDTWVLFVDENIHQPVKLLAINTYVGNKIFQETAFDRFEGLDEDLNVDSATEAMYNTYRIDSRRHLGGGAGNSGPPVLTDHIAPDLLPERSRVFVEENDLVDWMSERRSLRQNGMSKGIKYFTIEENSAADLYFHALAHRQLVQVLNFEFPQGCSSGKSADATKKYCLFASVDASLDKSITVKAGMTYKDVLNPDITAHLSLSVSLKKTSDAAVLDLEFEAGGCAVVFQFGEGVSLSINVCIYGKAGGKSLLQPDNRTFHGEAGVSVSFNVNLPTVGSVINWTIEAKVNCTAKPHNEISAYGMIGTSVSLKVAGAGVSLDIKGNTVEHIANQWEFASNVNFNAFVGFWKFKKTWENHWELWHAGPVKF